MVLKFVPILQTLCVLTILPFISSIPANKICYDPNIMYMPDNLPSFDPDCIRANEIVDPKFNEALETFSWRLYSKVAKTNQHKNIVISPLSIETTIAMVRMGAAGDTAHEIDAGLALTDQYPLELANNFHTILKQYQNSSIIKMANKLYINEGHKIKPHFDAALKNKFLSSIDAVNFGDSKTAASTINTWVEKQTNNLIQNLVSEGSLDDKTDLVLVNAIHFDGKWENEFTETFSSSFYMNETNTARVQMMYEQLEILYGDFPELDATAAQLRYANSDFSLLVVLPKSLTDLSILNERMESYHLSNLIERMSLQNVSVGLPKFKAEFEVELSGTLENLGMPTMFTSDADFSEILEVSTGLKVSKVLHKASIEFSEKGTVAAASTGIQVIPLSGSSGIKHFIANKPFLYLLTNSNNIIFSGNVRMF